MVRSFKETEAAKIYARQRSKKLPTGIQQVVRSDVMSKEKLHPVHPGEVLMEEFLKPMVLSQNRLALNIGVPPRRINEIVLGKRRISAETALRLARYFGTSPQFWLGLQADFDLDVAAEEMGERLRQEVMIRAKAG